MPSRRLLLLLVPVALLAWSALRGAGPVPPGVDPDGAAVAKVAPDGPPPAVVAASLPATRDEWRALYGEQGLLSQEETAALKARRKAAQEALQADIGASGAEGAAWALAALPTASGSRERLVLLGGLARNPSPEAVTGLQAVYAEEPAVRLREEALRALGRSEGEGATEALVATLAAEEDERLRQIAVQSLAGHPDALAPLHALAADPSAPLNVRLEAIPSIGAVRTPDARAALTALAQDPAIEPRIRQYAQRALARSGA